MGKCVNMKTGGLRDFLFCLISIMISIHIYEYFVGILQFDSSNFFMGCNILYIAWYIADYCDDKIQGHR